ncbi:ty3-gypsy retrotransposon protein [Tanacetum coccineum]
MFFGLVEMSVYEFMSPGTLRDWLNGMELSRLDSLNFTAPLHFGTTCFPVNLLLLPIYGADLVLGVEWLAGLGPILFDYKELWMEFAHGSSKIRLIGLTQPSLAFISQNPLKRDTHTESIAQYFHLSIDPVSTSPTPIVGAEAPAEFVSTLNTLFHRFASIFEPPSGLPPPRLLDHHIPLVPNTTPVNVKPYRYPHYQKSEIEKLVGEMLSDGIIRPSSLNSVTMKDRFPIPTVDELLDELHGARVFSKLDLRAGYHQVRIHPKDIEKTAFRAHEGHYDASWADHVVHLTMVFSVLHSNALFAKLAKCEFGCAKLGYLGHIISDHGVCVDPDKIESIRTWPYPTTTKGLRGFLGLTGYYRRFVCHYASLAAPLTQLLRKQAFVWTPATTVAFDALKQAMMTTPVLSMPNFSDHFILQTDASGTGVGAVLTQNGHPVAYFSKEMSLRLQSSSTYVRGNTPEQQKWITKLLGYDFDIVYKPGSHNGPADSLSRLPSTTLQAMRLLSQPILALWDALREFYKSNPSGIQYFSSITDNPTAYPHHSIRDGLLWHAGMHNSPLGGDHNSQITPLPGEFVDDHPILLPFDILKYREVWQQGKLVPQVLVQWENQPTTDATWEPLNEFCHDFPDFDLEGKVPSDGEANDAGQHVGELGPNTSQALIC